MIIDNLINYDGESLKNYIINQSDKNKRNEILQDSRIRDLFLSDPAYHYPFVWLVQELDEDSILSLLDKDFLIQLLSSEVRVDDKFNAIMTCGNIKVNDFLKNELFFEYIINCQTNHIYLANLNASFAKLFILYILAKHPDKINLMAKFKDNVQSEILDEKFILDILSRGINYSFIASLSKSALDKLCQDPVFTSIIPRLNIYEINEIISTTSLPMSLQDNSLIINKYLEIEDVNNYRFMVNRLLKNNNELYDNITKKRNLMTDNYINSIGENSLILTKIPEDKTMNFRTAIMNAKLTDNDILINKSKNHIMELIIDRYFEEIAYNFYVNLSEMINYLHEFNQDLISPENYKLYMQLYKYKEYSLMDLVLLYKSMNNGKNYIESFYDDYRLAKNTAYQEINTKSIKSDIINNNPSYIYEGVKVLELKGEQFYAVAHSSNAMNFSDRYKTTSLSVIGDKYIGLFRDFESALTLGFDEIPIDQIVHVYHSDSFTSKEYSTKRINEIRTLDSLITNTRGYNEILMKQKSSGNEGDFSLDRKYIFPNYIISVNNIKEEDLEFAKQYSLPILLFHEKDYPYKSTSIDHSDNDYAEERNNRKLN